MPKIEDMGDDAFDALFDDLHNSPGEWSEEDEQEYQKEVEGMTPEQLEVLADVEDAAREYKRCRDNLKALDAGHMLKPAPQKKWEN